MLEFILDEMDAGRLSPGSRVNAARISTTLGLSAAPVREALSVLAGRGVLDLLPDRGAVIRPMTILEYCQLWDVISAIASIGIKLAAEAVKTGADASELVACHDAIAHQPLPPAPLDFILRLNDWHYAANAIGGNPVVSEAMNRLAVPYWDRYLVEIIDVYANIDGYRSNYRRIHEAVMAGDGPAAIASFQFHAAWSVELSLKSDKARPKVRRPRKP